MDNSKETSLHVLGKASSVVVRKLTDGRPLAPNQFWVFVGYCFTAYKVNTCFDIIALGDENEWNHDYKIGLKTIVDEFGTHHKQIPAGYKSLCLIECKSVVPKFIRKLNTISTWDFKQDGIYLMEHSSVSVRRAYKQESDFFIAFVSMLKSRLASEFHSNRIAKKDFLKMLPENINNENIIRELILSGSAKEDKEELILENVY